MWLAWLCMYYLCMRVGGRLHLLPFFPTILLPFVPFPLVVLTFFLARCRSSASVASTSLSFCGFVRLTRRLRCPRCPLCIIGLSVAPSSSSSSPLERRLLLYELSLSLFVTSPSSSPCLSVFSPSSSSSSAGCDATAGCDTTSSGSCWRAVFARTK